MHPCAKARGCKPRRSDEIQPLCCVFQQYSNPIVFRADTLCCWSDGSVLSRFLLRNHCRVGTFIRIDFCVFSPFLFQLQSLEVWCFHTSVELLSVFFLFILQDRECCMAQVTWKCGSYSLVVTCTSDRCLDTETRVLFTTQSRNRTSTESDKYSQFLLFSFFSFSLFFFLCLPSFFSFFFAVFCSFFCFLFLFF